MAVNQVANGKAAVSPDAATKLMQAGQSKMGRLIDNHEIGRFHVDSHFDNRRGYQDGGFPIFKILDGFCFFFRIHLAMQQTN